MSHASASSEALTPQSRRRAILIASGLLIAAALVTTVAPASQGAAYLFGIPVEFALFGLMLTKAPIGRDTLDNRQTWLGALVGLGVFAGLVFLIQDAFPFDRAVASMPELTTTESIGESLFSDFVLPFEAVSFLLLAALIGAIVLSRSDEGN